MPLGETKLNEEREAASSKSSIDTQNKSHENNTQPTTTPAGGHDLEKSNTEPPGPPSAVDPGAFPDGGFEAWMVVIGGFCSVFSSFGWINCIGVYQDYYETHQLRNYSTSTVAWIPSVESCMMFFWGPVAGKMYDYYGPRWLILFGSLLHVFGLMMTSISKEYYQFLLSQGICSATGTSFLFFPVLAATGTWFKKHRALAFGVMVSGSSIGGIVLPIMSDRLSRSLGFGWSIRVIAFLFLGLLVITNLTVKSRLPPHPKPFRLMEFIKPFGELPFFLVATGSFLLYFGAFLPFTYLVVAAKENGMSERLAAYMIPILNAGSTFGRIIPGHLGDKYGVFNVSILLTSLAGILTLALWLPAQSNAALIVFAALYGIASGAIFSMIPAMVAQISDIRQLGVRNGSCYALISTAVLAGGPVGGAIVTDQDGAFSGLQIFSGVTTLVGVCVVVAARCVQTGWKINVKV